jgi:lipopolysaccharide export system permease protein
MIFNFFVLIPHTKILSKNFIAYKKQEAQFNLSASEFGHNFNNWLLYIGKSDENGQYQDILLFRKDKDEEILVGADNAEVVTEKGIFKLKLKNGQGYNYSEASMTQIDFETMHINNIMTEEYYIYRDTLDYWLHPHWRDYKIKKFVTHFLLAIFPLLSLFTILSIGILHTRHQKGHVYLLLAVATMLYVGSVFGLVKPLGMLTIPTIIVTWLILSYLHYRRVILARY